jgi:anaerobic selenocysteine-containing dehydrogenase
MSDHNRREFLSRLVVGAAAFSTTAAFAGSHEGHDMSAADSGNGHIVDPSAENTCGTCAYWGGMRLASKDKKQVTAQSMGWCNNPDSMNYQKLTAPDHVMKKTGMWKKWKAI